MPVVEVVIYDEFKGLMRKGGWILITGFPGFGYVGTIATRYLVNKLKAVKIGDVITKYMPDFTAFEDYGLMTPYEIFVHREGKLLILINNTLPQPPERVAYSMKLVDWFIRIGGSRAILAGGLNQKFREGDEEFRWACINGCGWRFKEPKIGKGLYIVGPLATLFSILSIRKVPTLLLFPYTEPSKYDPAAAAIFVKNVSSILNIRVDVTDLIKYGKLVAEAEAQLQETLKKAKEEKGPKPYM